MRCLMAVLLSSALLWSQVPQAPMQAAPSKVQTGPFDSSRDAQKDLEAAKAQAKQTGKRILVDVGGNWCSWCRLLHRFFEEHADLKTLRDKHFVFLTISYTKEQPNKAVLGQWPAIKGYPHFFVLDAQGKLLHSQDTGQLEEGKNYSVVKMKDFLVTWGKK